MKALYVLRQNNAVELMVGEMPIPNPASNELLIKVKAAGVTPTELSWDPTVHAKDGSARLGAIPGHEFSGVVVSMGSDVEGFAAGDEVYGINDWFEQGATAEYCTAMPSGIALKPAKLSHTEAAIVPISALTAWQGLFVRGKLGAGDRLLVHGGAGAVGSFVVQLAKLHGAEVIATCSHRNVEFLLSLKVDQVIDYEKTRFEEAVSSINLVFDTVGGDSLERSWPLLTPDGRAVTIATDSKTKDDARSRTAFFIVQPDHQQLSELGPLFEAGYLRPFVGATASLLEGPDAYRGKMRGDSGYGKTVVILP